MRLRDPRVDLGEPQPGARDETEQSNERGKPVEGRVELRYDEAAMPVAAEYDADVAGDADELVRRRRRPHDVHAVEGGDLLRDARRRHR